MNRRLGRLVSVTEAAYLAEQVKLSRLLSREQDLQTSIKTLEFEARTKSFDPLADAQAFKADLRWKAWCEREILRQNRQLALVRAERLEKRHQVARLFGRFVAAQKVVRSKVRN